MALVWHKREDTNPVSGERPAGVASDRLICVTLDGGTVYDTLGDARSADKWDWFWNSSASNKGMIVEWAFYHSYDEAEWQAKYGQTPESTPELMLYYLHSLQHQANDRFVVAFDPEEAVDLLLDDHPNLSKGTWTVRLLGTASGLGWDVDEPKTLSWAIVPVVHQHTK